MYIITYIEFVSNACDELMICKCYHNKSLSLKEYILFHFINSHETWNTMHLITSIMTMPSSKTRAWP